MHVCASICTMACISVKHVTTILYHFVVICNTVYVCTYVRMYVQYALNIYTYAHSNAIPEEKQFNFNRRTYVHTASPTTYKRTYIMYALVYAIYTHMNVALLGVVQLNQTLCSCGRSPTTTTQQDTCSYIANGRRPGVGANTPRPQRDAVQVAEQIALGYL